MHEVLHVAILVSVLAGAASLAVILLWPLVSETPLPPVTRSFLLGAVLLAASLLLLEWRFVH